MFSAFRWYTFFVAKYKVLTPVLFISLLCRRLEGMSKQGYQTFVPWPRTLQVVDVLNDCRGNFVLGVVMSVFELHFDNSMQCVSSDCKTGQVDYNGSSVMCLW